VLGVGFHRLAPRPPSALNLPAGWRPRRGTHVYRSGYPARTPPGAAFAPPAPRDTARAPAPLASPRPVAPPRVAPRGHPPVVRRGRAGSHSCEYVSV
jgi:hypothetical protein